VSEAVRFDVRLVLLGLVVRLVVGGLVVPMGLDVRLLIVLPLVPLAILGIHVSSCDVGFRHVEH
jgi:hypothetical protein